MDELMTGRRWRTMLDEIIDMEQESTGGFGPFERWRLNERAPERVKRLLAKGREHPNLVAANSPFASVVGQPSSAPSSFTPVGTTNVETNLWVPAIWTPIPANDMQAGKVYHHQCGGIFGTSSAAPTSVWTPRVGQSATPSSNVTMGASTATTMIASLSSVPFFSQFTFTIRTLGLAASGAGATGNGFVVIGGITTATGVVQSIGATVASTVDNTAATGYVLSQTWGTNAAANILTCQWVTPVLSFN
jgi:hypothetical protein